MASKQELLEQLRKAQKDLFPVAAGKMRKHEIARSLAALEAVRKGVAIPQDVPEAAPARGPRKIVTADEDVGDTIIHVPAPPRKMLKDTAPVAEKIAYRASIGAPAHTKTHPGRPAAEALPPTKAAEPKVPKKMGRPPKKATAFEEASELFPGLASHAAATGSQAVDEHDARVHKMVTPHRGHPPSIMKMQPGIVFAGSTATPAPAPAPPAKAPAAKKAAPKKDKAALMAEFEAFLASRGADAE